MCQRLLLSKNGQVEVKQRDHMVLRGEVATITLHVEQKEENERLAKERVEALEVRFGAILIIATAAPGFLGGRTISLLSMPIESRNTHSVFVMIDTDQSRQRFFCLHLKELIRQKKWRVMFRVIALGRGQGATGL